MSTTPNFSKIYRQINNVILAGIEQRMYDELLVDSGHHDRFTLFNRFLESKNYSQHTKTPSGNKLAKKLASNKRKKTGQTKQINQEFRLSHLNDLESRMKYGTKAVRKLHEAGLLPQLGFPKPEDYTDLLASATSLPMEKDILRDLLIHYWIYPTYSGTHPIDNHAIQTEYPLSGHPVFMEFISEQVEKEYDTVEEYTGGYKKAAADASFAFPATVLSMIREMKYLSGKSVSGEKEAVRIFIVDYRERFNFTRLARARARREGTNYIDLDEPQWELLESILDQFPPDYDWLSIDMMGARLKSVDLKGNHSKYRRSNKITSCSGKKEKIYWV